MSQIALSDPAPRKPLHTRTIKCNGFIRDDALYDIEGHLVDVKCVGFYNMDRGELINKYLSSFSIIIRPKIATFAANVVVSKNKQHPAHRLLLFQKINSTLHCDRACYSLSHNSKADFA